MSPNPVEGKTLRFTFEDGAMAGKTFEHIFEPGGSVRYRPVGAAGDGTTVKRYEAASIGADVSAISYLSSEGYTLTVVLDWGTRGLVAFASNEKMLSMQRGRFEEGPAGRTASSPDLDPPRHA